jgi:purine-binding chemotaxis protein CheW
MSNPSSPSPARQIAAPADDATAPRIAPQRAVQDYLNTLLQDATTQARLQDVKTVAVAEVAPTIAEPVIEVAPVEPEPLAPAAEPVVEVEHRIETEARLQPPEPEGDRWQDGRPHWAQQRFECLLFKVAGLTLAVPLVELGGVLVIEEDLRTVFGQPDWFLGLLPSKTEGTVKAIDTARWVMPEKYPVDGCERFKYVILVENSDWGMACHEVADAITLEPDQVSWRSDRGRRPWLAGTVVDHMCAIMDVAALKRLLVESQNIHKQS